MGTLIAIMAVPALAATGIYNPPVTHQGRCVAEPGSYQALYCPAPPAVPHRKHSKK